MKVTFNEIFFLGSMYLMIIMTIFNANEFVAGLAFVLYPSLLLLAVAFLFMRHTYNTNINKTAILLLLSACLSNLLTPLDLKSTTFGNLAFCILSFVVVSSSKLNDRVFSLLFKFYIKFSFLVCLVLLFNYIFHIGVQVYSEGNVRVSIVYAGIAKDVNYLSSFVVPCFVYYLYKGCFGTDKKDFVKAGLVFVAMFVAGSRACFLAMLAAAVLIFYRMMKDKEHNINKGLIIGSLLVGSLIVFYFISNSAIFARTTNFEGYTENSRLLIWECALEGFYRNPLIGSGVESGSYYSLLYTRWKTHNCFIDILTGQGIVGSIIMIALLIQLGKVSKTNRIYMISTLITFFFPLFFVNGYECATMWTPMMICRFLHEKCKREEDILTLVN